MSVRLFCATLRFNLFSFVKTMNFDVLTIFPDIFHAYLKEGMMKKAVLKNLLSMEIYNLRDFTIDRHRSTDDYPYGGGPGMVMKPEPLFKAINTIRSDGAKRKTILLSPQGRIFNQDMALSLSNESSRLLLVCGRYEAIDERVRESLIDEEISVGDYVLTGGELPALVIIDAVVRLIPGVLGDEHSRDEESFSWGILDYPHYTRPPEFMGLKVPGVLLSGNHKEIIRWRRREALRRTIKRRPDLIKKALLSKDDYKMIEEIKEENNESD